MKCAASKGPKAICKHTAFDKAKIKLYSSPKIPENLTIEVHITKK